jgi:hypothetical protein
MSVVQTADHTRDHLRQIGEAASAVAIVTPAAMAEPGSATEVPAAGTVEVP